MIKQNVGIGFKTLKMNSFYIGVHWGANWKAGEEYHAGIALVSE
jgi:hypothetical protein